MATPTTASARTLAYLSNLARNYRAGYKVTIRESTDIGGWRSSAACVKAGWIVQVTPGQPTYKITEAGLALVATSR